MSQAQNTMQQPENRSADMIHIVVPVYNEGDNILRTLNEIEQHVRVPYHVFIVYDFDEDNTLPPVKEFMKQSTFPLSLVKNSYGRGALNAIKTGFEVVDDGIILVMMADLSDDLQAVTPMYDKIQAGCDIVCGSRYMKGGKQIGGPWFKKLLSRIAGVSLHYLIGIPTHDITNSFKMYTRRIFSDLTIESTGGFELGMEIVIKSYLNGYKIGEVPSTWRDRSAGESRFLLRKWLPNYLHWYFYAIKKRIAGYPKHHKE